MWRAFGDVHVRPDLRPTLAGFAIDWWESRSRQRLAERSDHLAKVLWFGVYAHQTEQVALLESKGFEIRRYYDELVRDLSQAVDPQPMPTGIHLVPADEARPGDELKVHNEAFRDHWGSQPFSQERWEQFRNEFYLPSASYVAYDGESPVGHIFSTKYPHDFEDRGFTHSWIESIGVIPGFRKRGLATAMISAALADFIEDGMEFAVLDVDSENPTGAYGIYESQGFVLDRRSVALLKDV
jgi:ribosomal protein S18 acetylase RimI-like enzyme